MRRLVFILLILAPACRTIEPAALPGLPQASRPVVFVADGAGDFRSCSDTVRQTATQDGLNLEVVTFVWSHGYLRNLADQTDLNHMRQRGEMLAALINQQRQHFPDAPITLLAHSAGSGVVLAAAEQLPAETVDRIVLLSPSLSDNYDLRPALAATRHGIDAYVSSADWIWLGVLVRLLGTPDDPTAVEAAGRFGFSIVPQDPQYSKLRVHRWAPEDQIFGNDGGHFGGYQPAFLRRFILPGISKTESEAAPAIP